MKQKNTKELDAILGNTHVAQIDEYIQENQDSLITDERPFTRYMRQFIREKGLKQQDIFLQADIPERYGYKLISGEKKTRQRDVILRICYAAQMTLAETQRALKIYSMPELYSKIPRDAMLMILFNERPGMLMDVNELLEAHGMEPLRESGNPED